jgi:hypothetical protein
MVSIINSINDEIKGLITSIKTIACNICVFTFQICLDEAQMVESASTKVNMELHRLVWFMVFNATFNNISVISWQSVLLVEETGIPRENHRPVASH